MKNPNPQALEFSAYEAVRITVTMRPPLDPSAPWTLADTFQLNIRDQAGDVVVQSTVFVVKSLTLGIVRFDLTSTQTGQLDPDGGGDSAANPDGGDFKYDCWVTTPSGEKRIAWGPLSDLGQQWKP